MATKPSKEAKKIMWDPGRAFHDPELFFEWHGMKFFNKTVQPVSDEVYEGVKHIHNFHTVYAQKYAVNDFSNRFISGGMFPETENTMVF